jgi:hypothetical protein
MFIAKLMESVPKGGEEAHEAALTLGLLIERETVHRPAGDDGGISEILGDEIASRRLSSSELRTAVDELIAYITETPEPHPTAVWAVTKSYDPRILPHLINLLDRVVTDPLKEHLAYQALVGITFFYNELSTAAIRRAAERGYGLVKETATQYLRLFSNKSTDE